MLEFLALITGKHYWYFHSLVIKGILSLYGIHVGRNFYIEGVPRLKIRGKPGDIRIGNNVRIMGDIDIRNREQGSIIFEDDVTIDNDCRFVAANNAVLRIGKRTGIGAFSIFNCGSDVTIGEDCLFSGMAHIQSSQHGFAKGELILNQKHTYGKIIIGNDVWIAFGVSILKNVVLEDGCVVGAKSLVREGHFQRNSVIAGVPAVKIKERV